MIQHMSLLKPSIFQTNLKLLSPGPLTHLKVLGFADYYFLTDRLRKIIYVCYIVCVILT